MSLSLRQQAMRFAIWLTALLFVGRALIVDPAAMPTAAALLTGALGSEALLAYARSGPKPAPETIEIRG